MQTQIFASVVFVHKCQANMISSLHFLRFRSRYKSTNVTCVYNRFALSDLQNNSLLSVKTLRKHAANLFVCIIF